ncbi:competence protein ComK [Staphylococcus cohnii]|jgi:competence transcription factor ComK|uniref:Competence protein ComK n=1 Tax=Staphylococcus cohnii TaxID=29382 RepID=A0ABT6J4D6_9STAP|nr:competence protein ComK [Staphylococcus cohnii]MCI2941679.1 competence protein ComK [Staphylococcus cohnii]MDE1710991.1 competence protein ComK [Staphylococcus cohnii]MDH5140996.1 competence protein ComK [Staphylococcus cohnii]MDH5159013.1 competence protein ComK [Staphylococcus cohnii]MDH5170536.1 competence protein ComK [Staphylococcus cohnii]
MTQFTKLLYLKSVAGNEIITIGQYTTHQFHYPTSIMPTITYLLETYGLSLSYQTKQAKQILKIRKMVPIFITPQITLFPLKARRAPLQYYINANAIVGIKSNNDQTTIYFENATYIIVDAPYTFVYKKWQESITLSHLLI